MKVIVIVDVQNDFVSGSLGSSAAVKARDNLVSWLESNLTEDDKVIFTLDSHQDNYLETQEGKNLPIPHCICETPGWQLDVKVTETVDKIRPYQTVLYKDSFGAPHLKNFMPIDISTVEEIIFCGLVTDICVVSNVLITKSFLPEASISVIESCCAGTTPEKHEAALSVMESCQVKIIRE